MPPLVVQVVYRTTYWYSWLKPVAVPPPGWARVGSGSLIVTVVPSSSTCAESVRSTVARPPFWTWSRASIRRPRRAATSSPVPQTWWVPMMSSVIVRSPSTAASSWPGTVMFQPSVVCGR